MTNNDQQAFSLIEMLVAVVVLSIIGVITIRYVTSASRLYASVSAQNKADSEAHLALTRMQREVRLAQTTFLADAGVIGFSNRNDVAITFALSGTDLTLNGNVLAKDVDTFGLTYYDATNGLLSPLPLSTTNMAAVRRISMDLKISKKGESTDLDINFFYPDQGVLR